jgi:hypothetical protein
MMVLSKDKTNSDWIYGNLLTIHATIPSIFHKFASRKIAQPPHSLVLPNIPLQV